MVFKNERYFYPFAHIRVIRGQSSLWKVRKTNLLHVPKPFEGPGFLGRWPPQGFWDGLLVLRRADSCKRQSLLKPNTPLTKKRQPESLASRTRDESKSSWLISWSKEVKQKRPPRCIQRFSYRCVDNMTIGAVDWAILDKSSVSPAFLVSVVMAVPKRKHSNSRSGKRRSHNALRAKQLRPCPKCSTPSPTHVVCPNCGHYMGRTIVEADE